MKANDASRSDDGVRCGWAKGWERLLTHHTGSLDEELSISSIYNPNKKSRVDTDIVRGRVLGR